MELHNHVTSLIKQVEVYYPAQKALLDKATALAKEGRFTKALLFIDRAKTITGVIPNNAELLDKEFPWIAPFRVAAIRHPQKHILFCAACGKAVTSVIRAWKFFTVRARDRERLKKVAIVLKACNKCKGAFLKPVAVLKRLNDIQSRENAFIGLDKVIDKISRVTNVSVSAAKKNTSATWYTLVEKPQAIFETQVI